MLMCLLTVLLLSVAAERPPPSASAYIVTLTEMQRQSGRWMYGFAEMAHLMAFRPGTLHLIKACDTDDDNKRVLASLHALDWNASCARLRIKSGERFFSDHFRVTALDDPDDNAANYLTYNGDGAWPYFRQLVIPVPPWSRLIRRGWSSDIELTEPGYNTSEWYVNVVKLFIPPIGAADTSQ